MNWNEFVYEVLLIAAMICFVTLGGFLIERKREKAEKKMEAARMRFIRTELVPEIRDAILDVIVEANEESMEMIPDKAE